MAPRGPADLPTNSFQIAEHITEHYTISLVPLNILRVVLECFLGNPLHGCSFIRICCSLEVRFEAFQITVAENRTLSFKMPLLEELWSGLLLANQARTFTEILVNLETSGI